MEKIRSNRHELDRFLGPYPMESWQKWVSLTQHVTEEDLERIVPLSGIFFFFFFNVCAYLDKLCYIS